MSLALVLPGVLALAAAVAAGYLPWSETPRVSLRVLPALAAVTSLTFLAVMLSIVAGLASRFGVAASLLEWCPRLTPHHQVRIGEGIVALALLTFAIFRIGRVVQRHCWARAGTAGRTLLVIDDEAPVAYAAPGKPGCVVVSSSLLRSLDATQRQILFAHERAHLAQRHHRFLLVGALSQAVLPPLRRLVAHVEFAAERCADEAAVIAIGGNRRAVAATIGQVALATRAFAATAPGFGGSAVVQRVEALLDDPRRSSTPAALVGAAVVTIATFIAISVQMHHLYALIDHVCGR